MQARSETLCDFWADLRALCQRSGLEPGRARRHRGVDVAPSSKKSASGLRAGQISSRKRNVVPRRFPSGDSRVETIGSHFQLSKISVADLVPELAQFVRKAAQALARPAQRRHRIAARIGLDQRVQGVEKTGIRSLSDLRPPPGRRTRSRGVADGASSSFNPRPIVLAATPVTRDTAAMPPYPAARASAATKSRR